MKFCGIAEPWSPSILAIFYMFEVRCTMTIKMVPLLGSISFFLPLQLDWKHFCYIRVYLLQYYIIYLPLYWPSVIYFVVWYYKYENDFILKLINYYTTNQFPTYVLKQIYISIFHTYGFHVFVPFVVAAMQFPMP